MAFIFCKHFFKCISFNEIYSHLIRVAHNYVYKNPINDKTSLVRVMALRRRGDKPLSELMISVGCDDLIFPLWYYQRVAIATKCIGPWSYRDPVLLWKRIQAQSVSNRKCQKYVLVKTEYRSTMQNIKHYLKHENKVNKKYHLIVRH